MKWSIGDQTIDVAINRSWQNANEYSFYTRTLENGGPYVVDRGADSDKYSADIEVIGTLATVEEIVSMLALDVGRTVAVSDVNAGEKVFGPHITYTGDPLGYQNQLWQIEQIGTYTQRSLNTYSLPMRVTLVSGDDEVTYGDPPQVVTSSTPPAVWRPRNGYSVTIGDRRTVTQTYDMYSVDSRRNASANAFMCDLEFSTEDMAQLLGYYVYKRGAVESVNIPTLAGVTSPFGSDVSWPCAFHLVSITSVQMYAPTRWRCSAMIRRAVS